MDRRLWKSRLEIELIAAVLASLIAASVLFFFGKGILYAVLNQYYQTEDSQKRFEEKGIGRLQDYIRKNNLSVSDWEALDQWTDREKYVSLSLYQDGYLVYDSFLSRSEAETVPMKGLAGTNEMAVDIITGRRLYPVTFADGTVQALLFVFYEYRYDTAITAGMFLIAFAAFIAILVWFLHKKTSYIEQMEQELQILEGGDLDYEITVRGNDELASLARGINHMRLAVIERQIAEKTARDANHELVTAMSHDLRSPLTALIGYLDLLEMGKYKGEEQLKHFIHSSSLKSYQIKEMSDKLFEYFLIYGNEQEEPELEPVDIGIFLNQTVFESLFDLENRGFLVEQQMEEIHGMIRVNARMCQRVFDNVFSNLIKYADQDYPVRVAVREAPEGVEILIENRIKYLKDPVESTRIGIKTCEKIMRNQNGLFSAKQTGGEFRTRIYFRN